MTDRLAVPSDIARLLLTVVADCASRILPLRADVGFTHAVSELMVLLQPRRVVRSRQRMRELLGSSQRIGSLEDLLRDQCRMRAEAAWSRIRLLHGERWSARITLRGAEHLERARARGKGAIVWRMEFCDALVGHAACAQAGFPLTHLSHFHHGARTRTRLALNVIAPRFYKSEQRLVKERVVIGPSGALGYLRTLASRLASNEVVSIVGEHSAAQAVDARFFDRIIGFAPGAPGLAWQTDATLLTLHAVRTGPYCYEVVVSEPIIVDRGQPRRAWIEAAVAEYAGRLAQNVAAHPASWLGWSAEQHLCWPNGRGERG